MKISKTILYGVMLSFLLSFGSQVWARGDSYQADMQQRLNEQVLSKDFSVADDATLSKALDDATERGKPTKSKAQTGYYRYWYNGYYWPHPYSWYRHYGYW